MWRYPAQFEITAADIGIRQCSHAASSARMTGEVQVKHRGILRGNLLPSQTTVDNSQHRQAFTATALFAGALQLVRWVIQAEVYLSTPWYRVIGINKRRARHTAIPVNLKVDPVGKSGFLHLFCVFWRCST